MLPRQKTEDSFRQWEELIAVCVNDFPNPTVLDPKSLDKAAETICSRLRDAMRSYLENDWKTTLFTRERFLTAFEGGVVSLCQNPGKVTFGPPKAKVQVHPQVVGLSVMHPKESVLTALLVLHDEGLLTQPTLITGPLPECFTGFDNVQIEDRKDGTYLIL